MFSHLDKVDPSQGLEKATSQEKVEEVHKEEVSSPREISDTLDLARSFKTIRRDASISGQEVTKNLDSVLQRDLRRRLDSLVLISDQDKESVIVRKPTRSVITSTPRTSPPKLPPLPPRRSQPLLAPPPPPRSRSCSPSSSLVSSIHEEVFSDSEVFTQVNPPAASSGIFFPDGCGPLASSLQNSCKENPKPPPVQVIATMDWREAEKGVVDKCEELQTKIDLYTPDDIDGHYNEEEFYKKLGAMQDSYSEAKKSIRDLLCDYDDVMPTQKKEQWNRQATEIYERLKSHERQLRAAVTRAKGNLSAPASNSSASVESNASEVARAKRRQALSKMKTNEKAIEKDAGKLQDKIFEITDWKLEDDVSIGRGLKKADKWEKELEKIIEKMRELETLQREFEVEENEVECERLAKLVEDLEEDVEEVKKKIITEDNE